MILSVVERDASTRGSRNSAHGISAISVIETNPLIGRPTQRHKRELIIGRPTRVYIGLYRYVSETDTVFILALRSQREAGYKRV